MNQESDHTQRHKDQQRYLRIYAQQQDDRNDGEYSLCEDLIGTGNGVFYLASIVTKVAEDLAGRALTGRQRRAGLL